MPNPDWGVKRTCPSCAARFYDMMRTPIICPSCGAPFVDPNQPRATPSRAAAAKPKAAPNVEDEALVDEDDVDTEEAAPQDEDEGLDADDDAEDTPSGPTLSDEEEESKTVDFDDEVLLDEDEADDELEEDEEGLDDLDDMKPKDGRED